MALIAPSDKNNAERQPKRLAKSYFLAHVSQVTEHVI